MLTIIGKKKGIFINGRFNPYIASYVKCGGMPLP